METRNIDDLALLDMETVTKAQLAVIARTGKTVEGDGGEETEPSARLGVVCALGNLEQSVWLAACQQVVEREPDGSATLAKLKALFQRVMPDENEGILQIMALEAFMADAYDDPEWPYYEEYLAS